jgi:hypothetical protein
MINPKRQTTKRKLEIFTDICSIRLENSQKMLTLLSAHVDLLERLLVAHVQTTKDSLSDIEKRLIDDIALVHGKVVALKKK